MSRFFARERFGQPAVSRRSPASGFSGAGGLADSLRVVPGQFGCRCRAGSHRRRMAPTPPRAHRGRALPDPPGTLPAEISEDAAGFDTRTPRCFPWSPPHPCWPGPQPARPAIFSGLALASAPSFSRLRSFPRRFALVCRPPSLRQLRRFSRPHAVLFFSVDDSGQRRLARRA